MLLEGEIMYHVYLHKDIECLSCDELDFMRNHGFL